MTPENFRQQYPQGGIVSDLATVEHGQYIVRVLLQNNGVTLASGLAAAPVVEQAEDLARGRALALLAEMGRTVVGMPAKQTTQQLPTTRPVAVPTPVSPVVTQVPKPLPVSAPKPANEFKFELPLSVPPEPDPVVETETSTDSTAAVTTSPSTATTVGNSASEPLDFSDIIARSDVELKRLGWTSEQGRNYLLETYGKRSRQLLSDDELLEFLQHLESQPTP
ncbi:MAG: hypothetical protein WBB82_16465 [Limnothrix sp.]